MARETKKQTKATEEKQTTEQVHEIKEQKPKTPRSVKAKQTEDTTQPTLPASGEETVKTKTPRQKKVKVEALKEDEDKPVVEGVDGEEVQPVVEKPETDFADFLVKLQQLTTIAGSLRTEFKQLEKKYQKDIKLALKTSSKKKRKNTNRSPCGFTIPTKISDELSVFLGKPVGTEMARTAVTTEITNYIKTNQLQDKDNGRKIIPDDKLSTLLKFDNSTDELTYFNLQKYMKTHFATNPKEKTVPVFVKEV